MSLPLPPPPAATPEITVKSNTSDLDSLLSELNTPKEQIQSGSPAPARGQPQPDIDSPPVEPIPAEIAAASGKVIAGTIDTVLSTGFSLYAQAPSPEKYEASDKQIEKLNQAWAAVAQRYNYNVDDSPWFNVILLMAAVYFPIFKEAQKDHRFAVMDARLKEMEMKHKEHEARIIAMEPTPPAP
jgi:hypothetical protein